ncbi:glycosyltransferase [Pseudomonas sp.]|uniref:glycosyltransferase n=1 Tax=Pseudomonas sp. TaxID=306 RepID=UPI0028B0A844|nr:glycosyltransferase [Pseudomonas sp.]
MSHFALIAPPYPSHFAAFQALAGQLLARGHQVSFLHQAQAQRWVSDRRVGFYPVGDGLLPVDNLDQALRLAANPSGPLRLHRLIRQLAATTQMLCETLPPALRMHQVDAVLCDQMEPAGALAAEICALPWVSVACALPINREAGLPLPVMPFAHGLHPRWYDGSAQVHDWLMKPVQQVLERTCSQHGLAPRRAAHECLSPLAELSQTLHALDFPRQGLPAHFHAVGPLRGNAVQAPPSWAATSGKPLVFASLGTLQGHRFDIFTRIAKACRLLDVDLLLAHCGGLDQAQQQRLRELGATYVTDFAPQHWAVQQADVVVCHGGLNTVLDAVASHTALLVMPIAFDQHGVAARVRHHGLGLTLSRRASVASIGAALRDLLGQRRHGNVALEHELKHCGGAAKAADIIEAAVSGGRPVLREADACSMT